MALYDEDELDETEPGTEDAENIPTEIEDKAPATDPEDDPSDEIKDAEELEKDAASPDDKEILEEASKEAEEDSKKEPKEKKDKEEESDTDELDEDGLSPAPAASPMNSGSGVPVGLQNNPQLDKYKQFIDEYKRLQNQRRNGDLVNGLIAAGGKIGQSIAGKYSGKFDYDQSGNQMLAKMNERPVQDFEQKQIVDSRQMQLKNQMEDNDPASPKSKLIRDYLNQKLGMQLPDSVSAADAQQLVRTIGRPGQTKFQKVNGTVTADDGKEHRISAIFDPATGKYREASTGKELPNFLAEGLNPFQVVTGEHGEKSMFNKSRPNAPVPLNQANNFRAASSPNEVYAQLRPDDRKYVNDKIVPSFNKATEKTRQRLTHVPVILQRLKEAQTNPAALPQLKAEMARFDVGDQRLAQQEFDMFAKRQGYKGIEDWMSAHTTGTITPDFAREMEKAVTSVSNSLHDELSSEAEKSATLLSKRLPKEQNVDPKLIAPLIYGAYKPAAPKTTDAEEVRTTADGRKAVFNPKTKQFLRWADEKQ